MCLVLFWYDCKNQTVVVLSDSSPQDKLQELRKMRK